jgi:hypothetical protein
MNNYSVAQVTDIDDVGLIDDELLRNGHNMHGVLQLSVRNVTAVQTTAQLHFAIRETNPHLTTMLAYSKAQIDGNAPSHSGESKRQLHTNY